MAKRKPKAKEVQIEEIEVVDAIKVVETIEIEEAIEEPKEDYRESLRIVQGLLNNKPNENLRRDLLRTQTELQNKIKNL